MRCKRSLGNPLRLLASFICERSGAPSAQKFSKEEAMKSFLFGLGLGLGLGVLFAPMSGEETRNTIAQRASDVADQARENFEQGRDRVRSGITAIRNVAGSENAGGGDVRSTGTEGNI
jgi:hypothetical protein